MSYGLPKSTNTNNNETVVQEVIEVNPSPSQAPHLQVPSPTGNPLDTLMIGGGVAAGSVAVASKKTLGRLIGIGKEEKTDSPKQSNGIRYVEEEDSLEEFENIVKRLEKLVEKQQAENQSMINYFYSVISSALLNSETKFTPGSKRLF